MVSTPNSIAFNADLASPLATSARNSNAFSSITALYTPNPFSLSVKALDRSIFISSAFKGFSSKIIDLEIRAEFTSK